jgi:hypothetical protein
MNLWWFVLVIIGVPWLHFAWISLCSIVWCSTRSHRAGSYDELGSWGQQMRDLTEIQLYIQDQLIEPIKGTALHRMLLRQLGAKIGSGVCWLGDPVVEADMLEVGDETVVAPGVVAFCHNQENMRFTYDPISLGARCVLGERASVMGGTMAGEGARLLPLAQGMKGVTLLSGRTYVGNPAGLQPKQSGSEASGVQGAESARSRDMVRSTSQNWRIGLRKLSKRICSGFRTTSSETLPEMGQAATTRTDLDV